MSDELIASLGVDEPEDKQDDIRRKKIEVYEDKIESQHDELVRRRNEMQINNDIDLRTMPEHKIKEFVKNTDVYLRLAKNAYSFINDDFKGLVPYFAKNMILATSPTGNGKSTLCANLAYHAIMQGQKVLIITNEEITGDVYNRIICIIKGWAYVNHGDFTEEQREIFKIEGPKLAKRITVVDDNFSGAPGQTTSIEGVESILESLISKKAEYGVILFDYYQNVGKSNKNPSWSIWQCQEWLAKYLDSYKGRYLAPMVVLAQLLDKTDDSKSYKERIEGRKLILNTATCALEVLADRENQRTSFTIRKSRFSNGVGKTIYVGFDRGKYVLWTPEFSNKAQIKRDSKKHLELFSGLFGKAGIKGGKNENK